MARLLVIALVLALAGCSRQEEPQQPLLRVYSSLPHAGELRDVHLAALMAAEAESGVEHVALDSKSPSIDHGWEVGVVTTNARRAVADPRAMAYVGEIASGASFASMPVLGSAGLAQIAPGGTYAGLTREKPASHFARAIPADHLQASATVAWMRALGVKRLLVVDDGEEFGHELAEMVGRRAADAGIRVTEMAIDPRRLATIRKVAERIATLRPDTLYFGGIWQNRAPALWGRAHRADPRLRLMGSDALADPVFTRQILRSSRARTHLVDVKVPPPAAFARRFRERFGHPPHPLAVYGHDAMKRALAAVREGRGNRRQTVNALRSAPGLDDRGELLRGRFGGYRVERDGTLRLERELIGADDEHVAG